MSLSPSLTDLLRQRVQERTLARLWQEEAPRFPWLECTGGRRLRVLYPGRHSVEAGPDYRDAVLLDATGALLRGDVELHLRPGGWKAHGHHRDPNYNGTVLHVVLWPDAATLKQGEQTPLEAGVVIPVASLFPILHRLRSLPRDKREKVLGKGVSGEPLPRECSPLERAGDARFKEKAKAFDERIRAAGPEQALYEGVMEALGYHQNRAGFRALAARLPYALLRRAVDPIAPAERVEALEDLMLGAAGFARGPSRWDGLDNRPAVGATGWNLFRCRPDNHPRRRLLGMARLLDRAWEEGLVDWVAASVLSGDVRTQQRALTVSRQERADGKETLIGPQRAGEIAVNVALPFCLAWGRLSRDRRLASSALSLFAAWPALETNHMLREGAAVLGIAANPAKLTARWQQGVLHLYQRALAAPDQDEKQR